jgi:hypothetical protein
MPVTAPQWRFTQRMIQDAPDCQGVYVLWRGDQPLAVGHARGAYDSIRSRLLSHFSHSRDAGLGITHYSWQLCADPLQREAELARQLGLDASASAISSNRDTNINSKSQCRHAESESSSSTT